MEPAVIVLDTKDSIVLAKVHLTDWRFWEAKRDELLEVVRRQAVRIEELEAQIDNKE